MQTTDEIAKNSQKIVNITDSIKNCEQGIIGNEKSQNALIDTLIDSKDKNTLKIKEINQNTQSLQTDVTILDTDEEVTVYSREFKEVRRTISLNWS